MDMFRKWLSALTTEELFTMILTVSDTITKLNSKPFCTVREMQLIGDDIQINNILLKLVFEELNFNRELSEDEKNKLQTLLT